MKEFKYCHEEITMGVEIPVTVCETQKEMVAELVMQKESFDFSAIRMNEVEEKRINGYYNLTDGTLHEYAYREAMKEAISGTDEEMMYIIYKDGSEYWNGADEVHGKFKRYGIKRAIISTPWGYTVFGDFAINDMGDVTIEESEIEEYGVYAGQYDAKEQDEQEVQEVSETETNETTAETTAEQETVESISKMEITTETDDSGFEYYSVETAYEVDFRDRQNEVFKTYSEAEKTAGDNIILEVDLIVRNDKKAVSEHDKEVFEDETDEIECRCIWYHHNGVKGMIAQDTKRVIKKPETAVTVEQTEVEETSEIETAKPETVVYETMETVDGIMTDKEAYEIIGNRAKELIQNIEVQQKMVEIAKTKSKDEAEKWLYMTAVATLCGCGN